MLHTTYFKPICGNALIVILDLGYLHVYHYISVIPHSMVYGCFLYKNTSFYRNVYHTFE